MGTDQQVEREQRPRHDHTQQRHPHLDPPRSETTLREHVVNEKVEKHYHTHLEGRENIHQWAAVASNNCIILLHITSLASLIPLIHMYMHSTSLVPRPPRAVRKLRGYKLTSLPHFLCIFFFTRIFVVEGGPRTRLYTIHYCICTMMNVVCKQNCVE